MTEPRRFLMDPGASSFERDLLESWSAEQPAPSARARALALGGIAASGAAFAVGGGAVAPKAMSLAGMAVVKWGILGILVVGAATASVVSMRTSPAAPVVATTTAALPAPAPSPAQPTENTAAASAPSQEGLGTVSAADLPAVKQVVAVRAVVPAGDSLNDEIAAFDGVRAAEASGDADRTLALAAEYERRYPKGTFFQEAEVLRIESLSKKGDRENAARVGERFLKAHPESPHVGRIRAIVDASIP